MTPPLASSHDDIEQAASGDCSNRNDEESPLLNGTSTHKKPQDDSDVTSHKRLVWKTAFILCILVLVCGTAFANLETTRRTKSNQQMTWHNSGDNNPRTSNNHVHHGGGDWWEKPEQMDTTWTILPGELPTSNPSTSNNNKHEDSAHHKPRWGILGLGRIARDFTTALTMSGAQITAAAAGSLPNTTTRAKDFATLYHIPRSYGSYEEMAADPTVDIVYIATINTLHYETAMMMLQAGKNVLLEKPMTMDYKQAQELARGAKKAQRLLLTNYWTRFFPVVKYLRTTILANSDRLGPIRAMRGDFGFPTPPSNPDDRFLSRSSGGGAMLDVGCYLVTLATMVNPTLPQEIQTSAQTSYLTKEYQVDTEIAFALNWDTTWHSPLNGTTATAATTPMMFSGQASIRRPSTFEFEINALHGRVVIHSPANAANAATVYEYEPFGPVKHVEEIRSELPLFDDSYGPEQYPRGEGFVYVIREIEQCMFEKGIPGTTNDYGGPGCTELKELTMEDQLLTVQITDDVMRKAGYWDW